jgi:hypothetical protein
MTTKREADSPALGYPPTPKHPTILQVHTYAEFDARNPPNSRNDDHLGRKGRKPMLNDRPNPVDTWRVKITAASERTFEEPPPRGEGIGAQGFADEVRAQTVEGLLILEPDHTCLCLTPGPSAGTWQSEGPSAICFCGNGKQTRFLGRLSTEGVVSIISLPEGGES